MTELLTLVEALMPTELLTLTETVKKLNAPPDVNELRMDERVT